MTTSATWATPRDWSSGELLLAANMNTYLSNLLLWLKSPTQGNQAVSTTTTTSTSFGAVTGVTQTVTSNGGRFLICFTGAVSNNTGSTTTHFDVAIDGTRQGDTTNGAQYMSLTATANQVMPVNVVWYTTAAVAAGSRTFTLQWKVSGGTGTLFTCGQFFVRES